MIETDRLKHKPGSTDGRNWTWQREMPGEALQTRDILQEEVSWATH